MAVATTNVALNMNNWQFYEWRAVAQPVTVNAEGTLVTELLVNNRHSLYSGTGFSLTVDGIATGTLNQVQHFLNGVLQYKVTGLNHSASVVSDYLEQDSAAILSFLFNGNDTFTGSGFADQLNGYNGADKMDGRGGADKINGGGGNDTITYGAGDILNGSSGTLDTLKITVANVDLSNNTANPNTRLLNFEQVDLRTGAHTLKLAQADVLDMSSTSTIKILGDAMDTVDIVGAQVMGGDAPVGFTRYTIGSAILIIDSDINVV